MQKITYRLPTRDDYVVSTGNNGTEVIQNSKITKDEKQKLLSEMREDFDVYDIAMYFHIELGISVLETILNSK